MTISDEISIIANQLANQGKTPSVALIKGKLSQPTPLPKIIAVLKTWQHEPSFIKINSEESETVEPANTDVDNATLSRLISEAISPLQQEIKEIKSLLAQLVSSR
jgi:hypothetical protein